MEKFAVDLDKVLDELEFNEDRAENLMTSGSGHLTASAAPSLAQDHGAASLRNSGHTPLESGDHGTKWRPKPAPVSHKTSVSGVFSSLNEYINSGRVKSTPSSSQQDLEDDSRQVADVCSQLSAWSSASLNDHSGSEEKPDLIDSSTVRPSASTSAVPNEITEHNDRQSPVGTLLPDIATTGAFTNIIADEGKNVLDLLSHKSQTSDGNISDLASVYMSDVTSISTPDLKFMGTFNGENISNVNSSILASVVDTSGVSDNISNVVASDDTCDVSASSTDLACVGAEIEDNRAAPVNTENTIISFGSMEVKEIYDEELNDFLSDLEHEEREQEQQKFLSCELEDSRECDSSESQNESQTGIKPSKYEESVELNNAEFNLRSDSQIASVEVPTDDLSVQRDSGSVLLSEPFTSLDTSDQSTSVQDPSEDTLSQNISSTGVKASIQPDQCLSVSEDHSENVLFDGEPSSDHKEIQLESHVLEKRDVSPERCIRSESKEVSSSSVEAVCPMSQCSAENLSMTLQESDMGLSPGSTGTAAASDNLKVAGSLVSVHGSFESRVADSIQSSEDDSAPDTQLHNDNVKVESESESPVSDLAKSVMEMEKKVPLTLTLGDTCSVESIPSSPSTPPTVPVTPTLESLPVAEDFSLAISTSSTPFMTPTASFSAFPEEIKECNEEQLATSSTSTDTDAQCPAGTDLCQRPVRPSSLEIPVRTEPAHAEAAGSSEDSPPAYNATVGPPGATPSANRPSLTESMAEPQGTDESATESSIDEALCGAVGGEEPSGATSMPETLLGKEPPFWVPDSDAPCCMQCDFKFTVLKRRHHCRACGRVLCSKCCSEKAFLDYINADSRVCVSCKSVLLKAEAGSPVSPQRSNPNPNNPMEYCSTVPPLLQVAGSSQTAPTVMVPVGVLKREGSTKPKSEAKQVMFSDGIRPGADLAELDGSSEPRLSIRRTGRTSKRVGTPPGNASSSQRTLPQLDATTLSYVPHSKGLPPVVIKGKDGVQLEEDPDPARLMTVIRDESAPPVKFTINRNLYVLVKILNLHCCVDRVCWCFTSDGLSSVGQDEIVIILEMEPEESSVPKDIFIHLNTLYMEAAKGNTVTEMGHTLTQGSLFLGSKEHGGFLYVRPTFQCLHRLILPPAPYLVGVLIHKWETPWARVFPIRLMLRLGAKFRYYPCPIVSIRQRSAVYGEIGHTIIQILADFRNMAYTLPTVRGLVIHMEDKQTTILLPRNRYDQVIRALNNSNDHVLAFGANFSQAADSHLVCMQSDTDHSYHTQAINIHNKPRKVTGASFVVFNGALKPSCGMAAKSSIVEDGLMVKVTGETMASLKTALRDMKDLSITCGPINPPVEGSDAGAGVSPSDEVVLIKWSDDDRSFNIGVLSSVDGRPLDGVPSIRVHNGTDYQGESRFIRWTEVFILESEEGSGRTGDPVDISRLSEQLAKATCLALVKLLDLLATANLTTLAVRATIHPENVGYQAGSNGEKLPPIYMNSLDDELVPVLHEAGLMSGESPAVLELVFRIMESG